MIGADLILGVDGGGTSTTAWLADRAGSVIGRGVAGPSNAKSIGPEAARASLVAAIESAFRDAGRPPLPVAAACLGLAGFDRPEDRALLRGWFEDLPWSGPTFLVNDGDLVVAAGTPEGWGIGLIAGTGSIAVGRDRSGRTARSGGWGYLFGDEGSAFGVAVAGLRKVARRADGRERIAGPIGSDSLTKVIVEALGIAGPEGLIRAIHGSGFDRARIATLAPAVIAAMGDDSSIEAEIIGPAAVSLAEIAVAAARALGWEGGPLPIGLAGGFLLGVDPMVDRLLRELAGAGYEPIWTRVPDPVAGAIVIARRELDR